MKTNTSDRIAVLKRVALSADLSDGELAFLGERSSIKHFVVNELIFSEGDVCQGLYIVQSGAVKIFKMAPSGREQVLGVERSGNSVAELPVFDGGNYPASTIAVEDSDLPFVKKEDFRALCLEHPEVALKVLRVVGKRLRGLVGIIEELSFTTVRQRLIAYLLRIAGAAAGAKKSVEIMLPVSGTVRELVSRNLSRLQAEGLIKIQARSVHIPDLATLRAACETTD